MRRQVQVHGGQLMGWDGVHTRVNVALAMHAVCPRDSLVVWGCFGLTGSRSASDSNGEKDSEATARAHPLVHRFRTIMFFQALMRQEVCASPRRGKGVRIDGVQAFWGRLRCLGPGKSWLLRVLDGGSRFCSVTRAWAEVKRELPGVDTEQARSARGATALRCANARCALVGARAPTSSPTSGLAC